MTWARCFPDRLQAVPALVALVLIVGALFLIKVAFCTLVLLGCLPFLVPAAIVAAGIVRLA